MFRVISKEEELKFSDVIQQKYEFVRTEIFGDCPHAGNIATPYTLCEEMVSKLPDLNGKLVLVLFNPEFYLTIIRKYPQAKVVMVTGSENAYRLNYENGFSGIEHMILVNPFDTEEVESKIKKYEKYKETEYGY